MISDISDKKLPRNAIYWQKQIARKPPVFIGKNVTVGHAAVVHSATVDDGALIGMNATILNGAHIGKGCVVGGNALVTENARFEPNSLILGVPARAVGQVSPEMSKWVAKNCANYIALGIEYARSTGV